MTILALSIVDLWLVYQASTDVDWKQRKFYSKLAVQLIENEWDKHKGVMYKLSQAGKEEDTNLEDERSDMTPGKKQGNGPHGIGVHLTPVKEKNPATGWTWQRRCSFPSCRRQKSPWNAIFAMSLIAKKKGVRFFCCKPGKTDHWNRHMEEFHGAS